MTIQRKKTDAEMALEHRGYYQSIGKVASAWAVFELNIDRVIWSVAGTPQTVGACLTAQLIGPARRFDALVCLVRLFRGPASLIDKVQSLSGRAIGVGEKRNRVQHDSWFFSNSKDDVARFQITAKKELKFGLVSVTSGELDELLAEIESLSHEVVELGKSIMTELGPSLKSPPEWPIGLESLA